MQSPFLKKNSQKFYSSKKENKREVIIIPNQNKENISSNILLSKNLLKEFDKIKEIVVENPEKSFDKNSFKKMNPDYFENELLREIEEIFSELTSNEINSNSENKLPEEIILNLEKIKIENQPEEESLNLDNTTNLNAYSEMKESLIADQENSNFISNLDMLNSKRVNGEIDFDKNEKNFSKNFYENSNKGLLSEKIDIKKQMFKSLFHKLDKLINMQSQEIKDSLFSDTDSAINSILNNFHYSNFLNSENNNNNKNLNNENFLKLINNLKNKNEISAISNEEYHETILPQKFTFLNLLLNNITEICFHEKYFGDLLNFLLKNQKDKKIINLFFNKEIINFLDYEDSIFILAEDLTRNLLKIELLFELLKVTCENKIISLYPLFSVCLRKLVQQNYIQEAFILKNFLIKNFKMEISCLGINSLLEALFKNGRLDDALNFFKEIQISEYSHSFSKIIKEEKQFTKLSLSSGINIISYGILIKFLCKNNSVETALIHYEFLKSTGLIKDEIIFNLLIDGCAKTSNIDKIIILYNDMNNLNIKPSIITFNSILDAFVRAKDLNSAWKIYEDIKNSKNCSPDNFTFSTLFRGIRNSNHKTYLEKAMRILEELSDFNINNNIELYNSPNNKNQSNNLETNCSLDAILINVLIDSCISLKDDKNLIKIFFNAVDKKYKNISPDIITYNTFIKGCAQLGLFNEAQKAFEILLNTETGISPNDVSFNTMIDVYVRSQRLSLVWDLLELMKKHGINPDNFTYSTIIKGINKKSNFNNSNNNNNLSKNFIKNTENDEDGDLQMAFNLFRNVKMHSKPDEILYNCIMDACLRFDKIDKMMECHEEMIKDEVKPSSITCGILIKAYGMRGMVEKALEVYENMKNENIEISSVTYGCLINACIKNNNLQKSFELYQELDDNNIEMNTVLYTTMIKAYSKKSNLAKVIDIFNRMKKDKNNYPNIVTYNSVIDCCIKCNNMREAESKLEELIINGLHPDIITFSTLIKGCLKNSMLDKAIEYLRNMIDLGIKPDEVLLNSLLDGCEKMNKFSQARDLFLFVRKFGVEPSMMSFSIMMKIYGKLKDYNNSKLLLEEVKTKQKNCSLIIFTCFIKTCLQTKNFQEALLAYESFKNFDIQADEITINTIIKGLIINKAFEYIPRIILDSLIYICNFRKTPNYSEAINALHKNLTKAKITESDLFEIRRKLALNNIYVEIDESENGHNSNLNSYCNFNNTESVNGFNNTSFYSNRKKIRNNYGENSYVNQFNNQNKESNAFDKNTNFNNGNYNNSNTRNNNNNFYNQTNSGFNKNKKQRNNYGKNYHNQNNFNAENPPADNYIDNYDFLINGYKNKSNNSFNYNNGQYQNFNNNNNSSAKKKFNKNNFNNYSNNKDTLNYDSSNKKENNEVYNKCQNIDFYEENNQEFISNQNKSNSNINNMLSVIDENSNTYNENFNLKENKINNLCNFTSADETGFFDKPSLDISAIQKIPINLNNQVNNRNQDKNEENSISQNFKNIENNAILETNKLKERSSFYKNFANFNEMHNSINNFKNEQKEIILQNNKKCFNDNISGNFKDGNSNKKLNIIPSHEADKENTACSNFAYNNNNNFKRKNVQKNFNISNYNFENSENANANNNPYYKKKQIFRKGFNIPNEENDSENKYSHTEHNASAIKESNRNNYPYNKINKGGKFYSGRENNCNGNDFNNNPSQQNFKPAKKLTRF